MSEPFQVLEDCPDCGVEGAIVGLVDPEEAEGVTLVARCRLCGREERRGAVKRAGRAFRTVPQVQRALERWAMAEGTADLEAFCEANMGGLSPAQVGHRVLRGEGVATSFDVVAFLFPGMGGGAQLPPGLSGFGKKK